MLRLKWPQHFLWIIMIFQRQPKQLSRLHTMVSEGLAAAQFRIDELVGFPRLRRRAARDLGYVPNLKAPKKYNEKIVWRKAFDRNPDFVRIADKIEVRSFIAERLGQERTKDIMLELYATASRFEDIDLTTLPDSYAMKANHASGWNAFVTPESPVDPEMVKRAAKSWLSQSYGRHKHEWAYQPIKRRVLFEELMVGENGAMPRDIKFAVFNGKCRFIVFIDGRFKKKCWYHMTPEWERLLSTPKSASDNPVPEKPEGFDEMLSIAEEVSQGFDYFRVDFMFTPSRFVLNEITLYDASGSDPLDPPIWDDRFGVFWTLPEKMT